MNSEKVRTILSRCFYSTPITSYIALIMIFSSLMVEPPVKLHLLIASMLISGYDVIYTAVMAVMKKRLLSAELITLISVIGTCALKLWVEAAAGMAVFSICRSISRNELEYRKAGIEYRYQNIYSEKTRQWLDEMDKSLSNTERQTRTASVLYSALCFAGIIVLSILIPLVWRQPVLVWLRRAFIIFAVSVPGAFELCSSFEFTKAIDECAELEILYKNRAAIEKSARVTSVVFNRIDSVSSSRYGIADVVPNGIGSDELLMLAAYACEFSSEPEAYSLVIESGIKIDSSKIEMYKELPGIGSAVILGGVEVAAGNEQLMSKLGVEVPHMDDGGLYLYVCAGKRYAGYIKMAKPAKPAGAEAVDAIHSAGVDRVILITEEKKMQAKNIADKLGLDEVWPEVEPDKMTLKLKNLQEMQLEGEQMGYVCAGGAESEAMKMADVGISIGQQYKYTGGDILIPDGSYYKIAKAISCARQLRNNIRRNLVLAAVLKAVSIVLAIAGASGIWLAAVIDTVITVAVVNFANKQRG